MRMQNTQRSKWIGQDKRIGWLSGLSLSLSYPAVQKLSSEEIAWMERQWGEIASGREEENWQIHDKKSLPTNFVSTPLQLRDLFLRDGMGQRMLGFSFRLSFFLFAIGAFLFWLAFMLYISTTTIPNTFLYAVYALNSLPALLVIWLIVCFTFNLIFKTTIPPMVRLSAMQELSD